MLGIKKLLTNLTNYELFAHTPEALAIQNHYNGIGAQFTGIALRAGKREEKGLNKLLVIFFSALNCLFPDFIRILPRYKTFKIC